MKKIVIFAIILLTGIVFAGSKRVGLEQTQDSSLSFIVFSDPHRHIDDVSKCIEDIKENSNLPVPEFIFSTGDQGLHGHPGPDESTIEYMMKAPRQKYGWNDLLLPYFVLWGNHDVTSYHAHPKDPFFIPYSKKDWGQSNPFYAFEYDNILFLVVSSALGETRLLNQPQRDWLEQITSMYPNKTTMIMTHRALYNSNGFTTDRAYQYFMETNSWWKPFLKDNPQIITYGYGHTAVVRPLRAKKFGVNTITHAMMAHGSPNTITYYEVSSDGVDIKYWNGEKNEWSVSYLNDPSYYKNDISIDEETSFKKEGMDWFSYSHVFQDGEKLSWDNRFLAKDYKVQLIGEGEEEAELVWMNRKFNYFEPEGPGCAARWIGYESDVNNGTGGETAPFYSEKNDFITFNSKDVFATATSTMSKEPPCTHERGHVPWSTTPWAVPGKAYKLRVKMKGEGQIKDAMSVKIKVLSRDNYARAIPGQPIDDPLMEEVVLDKVDLEENYNWYEGSFTVPDNEKAFIIKTIWESQQDGETCYLDEWSMTREDREGLKTEDFGLALNDKIIQTKGCLPEGKVKTFNLDPTTIDNKLNFKAKIGGSRVGMVRLVYDDPILWSDDVSMGIKSAENQKYNCHFKIVSHSPEDKVSLTPLSSKTEVQGIDPIIIRNRIRGWRLKKDNFPGEFLITY